MSRLAMVGDDRDRGAALIEFSVVMGLLLYLILGAISFGVLLAATHQLNEAAGESARAAALAWDDPATTSVDERAVRANASLVSSDVECDPGPVTCGVTVHPCGGQPALDCVTVTLTHDRTKDPIVGRIPLLENVLPGQLRAEATAMVNP